MKPKSNELIKKIQSELDELDSLTSSFPFSVSNRILEYSDTLINKLGKKHHVVLGKSDKRKFRLGNCYQNSVRKTQEGYQFVEGYILNKETHNKISHGWNVDNEGNHFDFTLDDNNKYDYFGLIIPIKLVYEIGRLKGGVWGSCLPYIELEDTDLV